MADWYYARNGQRFGPFSQQQLQQLAKTGALLPDDLLLFTGAPKWLPARLFPDFFAGGKSTAVPQPVSDASQKRPSEPATQRLLLGPAPVPSAPQRTQPDPVAQEAPVPQPAHSSPDADPAIVVNARPAKATFRQRLLQLPKPLLFGIFGAVGGLFGAVVLGEVLWLILSPAGRVPPEPPPTDPLPVRMTAPNSVIVYVGTRNSFDIKLARNGNNGPLTVKAEGVPAHAVILPNTLDGEDEDATFTVHIDKDQAPGHYPLRLRGRMSGSVSIDTAEIDLNVEPVPPALRLSVSPEVQLYQGGKCRFTVKAMRTRFEGPIALEIRNAPPGATFNAAVIPENRDEIELEGNAARDQVTGDWTPVVHGTADISGSKVDDYATFKMQIMPAPGGFSKADVLFVLDLTGSMGFAIEGVKKGIEGFTAQLKKKNVDARVGLICFRDIEEDKEWPFVSLFDGQPFTTDPEAIREKLKPLKASGGGDEPESSLQALALAAEQQGRSDAAKVLVLITDASPKIHNKDRLAKIPKVIDTLKDISTIPETMTYLQTNRVNQVHFVIRQANYIPQQYKQFHDKFKGEFFDLTKVNNNADALAAVLPKVGEEISLETVGAAAVAPKEATVPLAPQAEGPKAPPRSKAPPPPPVDRPPAVQAVQSTAEYTDEDKTRLVIAIGIWTMVMAGFISLLLLIGQRYYAGGRWRPHWLESVRVLGGGFLAGAIGGMVGQLLFQSTTGSTVIEVISRILGWSLLGALAGLGVSFVVPNLRAWRGTVGGLVGGFMGAIGFIAISSFLGGLSGRWAGAAILGFFIGLMVALVEFAFRRIWLEIAYGPRELRILTLGGNPVSIGGDEHRCSAFVRGGPPIALRYRIDGDRILCEDVLKERTEEVQPGYQRSVGNVVITVCSADKARSSGFILKLTNGSSFILNAGLPLMPRDLPGLEPQSADDMVAVVAPRPANPNVLLLRNRSRQTWTVQTAAGQQSVPPGQGIELAGDIEIAFGTLRGTIRRADAASR